jgi:hypothetical protein
VIKTIVTYLTNQIAKGGYTDVNYGLVDLVGVDGITEPRKYIGGGEYKSILDIDNYRGVSFIRKTNAASVTNNTTLNSQSCTKWKDITVPLRLVIMTRNDESTCDDEYRGERAIATILKYISEANYNLKNAIKAKKVTINATNQNTDSRAIYRNEFGKSKEMPYDFFAISIDVSVLITISESCIIEECDLTNGCDNLWNSLNDNERYECILRQYDFTSPLVLDNLTAQQEIDIIAHFCNGAQPIDIYINGVLVVSQTTVDTYLDVVNTANTPVGLWSGTEWIAPDGGVRNSDNSYGGSVPSGGNLQLPDIRIIDSDGTPINYPAVNDFTCTPCTPCADATVNVNSTLFDTVASGGTLNISVRQQSGSTEIGSKQGQHWRVNNSAITVNSASLVSLPATDAHNLDIKYQNGTPVGTIVSPTLVEIPDPITPSGIAYQRIDKNVEASSFINGDEWFYELAGKIVDVATPAYPVYVQEMDFAAADPFLTLKHNNVFGNKNRFTVHPTNADIIYDHLYAVTWWKGYGNTSGQMHAALTSVAAGTVVDGIEFRPCTEREMKALMNQQIVSEPLNYAPLNYSNSTNGVLCCSWSNNTNKGNTSGANVGQFRRLTGATTGGAAYGEIGIVAANSTAAHQFIMINREGTFNPI